MKGKPIQTEVNGRRLELWVATLGKLTWLHRRVDGVDRPPVPLLGNAARRLGRALITSADKCRPPERKLRVRVTRTA